MTLLRKNAQRAQQLIEYILVMTAVVIVVYAFVSRTSFKQMVNENLKAPLKMIEKKQDQLPR